MNELMLKRIPALKGLPILDAESDEARALASRSVCELAKADDPVRVHDILHRAEYKPVAAVRGVEGVCVYFEIRDESTVPCDS